MHNVVRDAGSIDSSYVLDIEEIVVGMQKEHGANVIRLGEVDVKPGAGRLFQIVPE